MKIFALFATLIVLAVFITGCANSAPSANNIPSVSGQQEQPSQIAQDSIDNAVVNDSDTVELGELV